VGERSPAEQIVAQVPCIFLVSQEDVFQNIRELLPNFECIILDAVGSRALQRAIELRAAFTLLDGRLPGWRDFVLACKTNAAIRRMPICLVSDDSASRRAALLAGAELALDWTQLDTELVQTIETVARVLPPVQRRQLDCECQQPLPQLAQDALELFQNGEYYRQHDLLEELWMATDGPVRDLYRGVLQVGIAYYHLQRGKPHAALKMLQRSVQWLQPLPEQCQGIDVAQLRRDSATLRATLQGEAGAPLEQLLKPPRYSPSPKT